MSRQTVANRRRSVATLQERAAPAPLVVEYHAGAGKFVVSWNENLDEPLIAGRYQVVGAYIDGFVRAWINRPR